MIKNVLGALGALILAAMPAAAQAGTIDWLLAPISGVSEHYVAATTAWHGRLMVLAWAVLMPAALVVVRYFKVTPRQQWPRHLDNPFWFIAHRRLGNALVLVMTLAVGLMLWGTGGLLAPFRSLHITLGWLIFVLASLQIIGSYLRGTHGGPMNSFTRQPKPPAEWPGDHYSMTRRRIIFERAHKGVGYLLIALAIATVETGLWAADAPVWMWLVLGLWWIVCAAGLIELQRRVGCIDTYQAIWGLDPALPGYRHRPIGVGITRFTESNATDAPWQKASSK
ncbi:MAG TPA: cytochrome b561 domain-containing protein [Bauldia sp.]